MPPARSRRNAVDRPPLPARQRDGRPGTARDVEHRSATYLRGGDHRRGAAAAAPAFDRGGSHRRRERRSGRREQPGSPETAPARWPASVWRPATGPRTSTAAGKPRSGAGDREPTNVSMVHAPPPDTAGFARPQDDPRPAAGAGADPARAWTVTEMREPLWFVQTRHGPCELALAPARGRRHPGRRNDVAAGSGMARLIVMAVSVGICAAVLSRTHIAAAVSRLGYHRRRTRTRGGAARARTRRVRRLGCGRAPQVLGRDYGPSDARAEGSAGRLSGSFGLAASHAVGQADRVAGVRFGPMAT